ncbi:hypothetical protein VZT92_027625 [Zoarces viviparus]|uniref:Uncharacterized protein n=1 Tax=Zoarces viviparus TaxID=48416 RepID=A0AAW1DV27_ZOAVI
MTQPGERGRMHAGEDEKAKTVVEEEEEEEEEEGGRGEKGRAGPPLLPASQPALSAKLHRLLDGAESKTETMPHPAAPAIDKDQSDEGMD